MNRRRLPAAKRFALALIVLAGCASDPHIDQESWQDAAYDEVVAQWGPPASSSKLDDGTDVHLWITERAPVSSGATVGFGVFGGGGRIGSGVGVNIPIGPPPAPIRCERRLYFTEGRVVDEEWLGAPAVCKDFRRR